MLIRQQKQKILDMKVKGLTVEKMKSKEEAESQKKPEETPAKPQPPTFQ